MPTIKDLSVAQTINECKEIRDQLINSGRILEIKQNIKTANKEEKTKLGQELNTLKKQIEEIFNRQVQAIQIEQEKDNFTNFDPTFFSFQKYRLSGGSLHPITLITQEITDIFKKMGFEVVDGPLVETQDYCMSRLNIPDYHPARSMQDTFYLKQKDSRGENLVLRTHTSAVQIRYGESHKPPFKIVAPGQVYRNEKIDATHDFMFHQIECLVVDRNISTAHLKTLIEEFFNGLFPGANLKFRLRANYFPYTIPSLEIDISNPNSKAKGEWLEVGGAGLVHPKVIVNMGLDSNEWQGLAFGFGLDRMAQIKYGFHGLSQLFEGNLNFLKGKELA